MQKLGFVVKSKATKPETGVHAQMQMLSLVQKAGGLHQCSRAWHFVESPGRDT